MKIAKFYLFRTVNVFKSDNIWRFYGDFRKKGPFYALFGYNRNSRNPVVSFANMYCYKIAKNRPIERKLTVLNRQDFAIFNTPWIFEFGPILRGVGSHGNFGSIFGRLKFYVCSYKKWTLIKIPIKYASKWPEITSKQVQTQIKKRHSNWIVK